MSAIAGVIHLDGSSVPRGAIDRMLASLAHRGSGPARIWREGPVGLGHIAAHPPERADGVGGPAVHAASGCVVVADARIDNRSDLAKRLGVGRTRVQDDAALILRAYERWGNECAAQLIGDFAFVVWDPRRRELLCARDGMGVRPFYFHRTARRLAFASEVKALFTLPDVPREIDDRQIALYLEGRFDDRVATTYRGIERLAAGHAMTVTDRRVASTAYWTLDSIREVRFASDEDYVDGFREIFTEAVRARLVGPELVGATLSGGLDSSSIVCVARDLGEARQPLPTFSLVFPSLPESELEAIDERRFMDAVAQGGGIESHVVRADLLSPFADIDRVLWHVDEPHPAPNLYLHWGMYAAARARGVGVLLDGFDGDSAVSHGFGRLNGLASTDRWSEFETEVRAHAHHRGFPARAVLRHYGLPHLSGLARSGEWRRWWRATREIGSRFGLSRRHLALRHGFAPIAPSWTREAWRAVRGRPAVEASMLSAELRSMIAPEGSDRSAASAATQTEREMHAAGLAQPLYQLTLEIADKCARAFGIEPRYPFFDRRLIEYCLALPDEQKFAGGWPRYAFRRAMEGILPPEIQWRATKGNLSPNLDRAMRTTDRSVLDALTSANPRVDRYVDRGALTRVARRYLASSKWGHPDGLKLFRAGVLTRWIDARSPGEHASPTRGAAHHRPNELVEQAGFGAHGRLRREPCEACSGKPSPGELVGTAHSRPHDRVAASPPHEDSE
jgi:asparagine synthase (glutamine-hydrolysing)